MKQCGSCSLCCKVFQIDAIEKPPGQWCIHGIKPNGCAIYETRPEPCRTFVCVWMQLEAMPEELKPNRCHAVLTMQGERLVVTLDPHYPDAVASGALAKFIAAALSFGNDVAIVVGTTQTLWRGKHRAVA